MRAMPGGAVLLARVPADGLDGAQAGVRRSELSASPWLPSSACARDAGFEQDSTPVASPAWLRGDSERVPLGDDSEPELRLPWSLKGRYASALPVKIAAARPRLVLVPVCMRRPHRQGPSTPMPASHSSRLQVNGTGTAAATPRSSTPCRAQSRTQPGNHQDSDASIVRPAAAAASAVSL